MAVSGRRWVVPVIVVVVAAILGAAGVIVFIGPAESAGASVRLEAAGRPGTDPFTTSVTIGETAAFPDTIHAITTHQVAHLATDSTTGGLQAQGSAPGLYGGTGNNAVCDPHQLADFLTHNPTKATAWANVLGIRASQIADYITTLTPVVLTTDTRVTNHGYRNGTATTLQSVLQAGTAVLVDPHGTPRVKCGCGNPLTPPTSTPIATTTGTPWTSYQPATVTTITPTPKPQDQFTLTNLHTGTTYTQPTGNGTGTWLAVNAKTAADYSSTYSLLNSEDGRTWTTHSTTCPFCGHDPVLGLSGLGYGNGRWLATTESATPTINESTTSTVFASDDGGKTWDQTATLPVELGPVAFGDGHWIALGQDKIRRGPGVEYTSADGTHWTRATATGLPGADYLGGYVDWSWNSVAFGGGSWVTLATDCSAQCHESVMFTSTNGTDWHQADQPFNDGAVAAYGSGQWVVAANADHGYDQGQPFSQDQSQAVVAISRDLAHWSETSVPAWGQAIAFGGGTWLLAAQPGVGTIKLFSSPDAHTWTNTGTFPGSLAALAFGSSSTKPAGSTSATKGGSISKARNASSANFCSDMRALEHRHPGLLSATRRDLPEIRQAVRELKDLEHEAPGEIRDGLTQFVDYVTKTTSGRTPSMSSSEFTVVSSRVDAYVSDHCNL